MLPSYVMLDLETTGGNPVSDRIIEIAAVRVEEGREVARWSTLVNPGRWVSPFITSLTGIDNAMVSEAPRFEAVAPRLLELLDGAVLVAHNARFDHGFLKNEFQRIDIDLRTRLMCTVRLSRKLYPQHKSHGLDAILRRHNLHSAARHRAMGDVDAVLDFLALARGELGVERLRRAARELVSGVASVPPHLESALQDIPDATGVYLMYGDNRQPLYVGKSLHLRARVLSHFQSDHATGRDMQLAQGTRQVEFRRTAGELGALLLESRLVKELQPAFNRKLRRTAPLYAWQLADDPDARPQVRLLELGDLQAGLPERLHGMFKSAKAARQALLALADAHGLCAQVLGLEAGTGRCFAQQVGRCRGACCGQEDGRRHLLRVQLALAAQRMQDWPFSGRIGVREHDPHTGRTDIHVFDRWCHLATVHDEAALDDALDTRSALAFDVDTYQLLRKRLLAADRKPGLSVLTFGTAASSARRMSA
ncbi:MAG: DNA polymerase III subunit epsilon [Rhodoferax sp.]|nr:DNA polymerase III subunit epsilon [Rhodoferax sp.]